jgi:hypothetical protein
LYFPRKKEMPTTVDNFVSSQSYTTSKKAAIVDSVLNIQNNFDKIIANKTTIDTITATDGSGSSVKLTTGQYTLWFSKTGSNMLPYKQIIGAGYKVSDTFTNIKALKLTLDGLSISLQSKANSGVDVGVSESAAQFLTDYASIITSSSPIFKAIKITDTLSNLTKNQIAAIKQKTVPENYSWLIYVGSSLLPETNKNIQGRLDDLTDPLILPLIGKIYSNGNVYVTSDQNTALLSKFANDSLLVVRTDSPSGDVNQSKIVNIYPDGLVEMTEMQSAYTEAVFPDVSIVVVDSADNLSADNLRRLANDPKIYGVAPTDIIHLSKADYVALKYLFLNDNYQGSFSVADAVAQLPIDSTLQVLIDDVSTAFTTIALDILKNYTNQIVSITTTDTLPATMSAEQATSLKNFFADGFVTVNDVLANMDSTVLTGFVQDAKIYSIIIGTKQTPDSHTAIQDRIDELFTYFNAPA